MKFLKTVLVGLLAAAAALASLPGLAQDYPNRAIRMIVPQPPGGGFDLVGRVVANKLSELLGSPVVVDNRSGAGTLIGTEAAIKAPADGYTLLVGGFSNIVANVGLYKQLSYDPQVDLVPVGMVMSIAYVMVSRKDLPMNSLREIIEFARANPGKLTYASGGIGTGQHIVTAALADLTGVRMSHIPYRGAQAAYQDLLSGRLDLFFDNAGTATPYLLSGGVKGYAVSTKARFARLPNLPAVSETGVANLETDSWFGIFARSGTPAPALERLRAEMTKVVASPDVSERFEKGGSSMMRMSAAEAEAFVKAEIATWPPIIRRAGISAD